MCSSVMCSFVWNIIFFQGTSTRCMANGPKQLVSFGHSSRTRKDCCYVRKFLCKTIFGPKINLAISSKPWWHTIGIFAQDLHYYNDDISGNWTNYFLAQWGRKFKKVQAKKLMKSNKSFFCEIAFLTVLNLFPVQKSIVL